MKEEQARMIGETVTRVFETAGQKGMSVSTVLPETKNVSRSVGTPRKVRSITEAPSHQRADEHEIDNVIWPLFDAGCSVRAIATQKAISTGTVGRSRKRWSGAQKVSPNEAEIETDTEAAQRA
jgi:hypothetical protein